MLPSSPSGLKAKGLTGAAQLIAPNRCLGLQLGAGLSTTVDMTTEETALADKILKEAMEASAENRLNLLDQYAVLLNAALKRRDASEEAQP